MGKVYEKDTNVKLPNWYRRLPTKVVDLISDIGIFVNTKTPNIRIRKKKHTSTPKRNVKFYL